MKTSIEIESRRLDAALPKLLVKTKESVNDLINYLASRFVSEAIPLTVRAAGRPGKRGIASSASAAKKEHADYLKERIKNKRLRRWGNFSRSGRNGAGFFRSIHLPKKETAAYYRRAMARQGELAAGWNAAALATKAKYPSGTAHVKRHGNVHGAFARRIAPASVVAEVRWEHSKGTHGNMESIAAAALKIVTDKAFAASARSLAANIRRQAKKLLAP